MRKAFICCLVLLLGMMAFAAKTEISWKCNQEVAGFRYRIDDQQEWTYIDGSVNSVVVKADGKMPHTFYIQATNDGLNWGDTATSVWFPSVTVNANIDFQEMNYVRFQIDSCDDGSWMILQNNMDFDDFGFDVDVYLPHMVYFQFSEDAESWNDTIAKPVYPKLKNSQLTDAAWRVDNSGYGYMRYQTDIEDENGWIETASKDVVEVKVSKYREHSLLVQLSGDGRTWTDTVVYKWEDRIQDESFTTDEVSLLLGASAQIVMFNEKPRLDSEKAHGFKVSYAHFFNEMFGAGATINFQSMNYYIYNYTELALLAKGAFRYDITKSLRVNANLGGGINLPTVANTTKCYPMISASAGLEYAFGNLAVSLLGEYSISFQRNGHNNHLGVFLGASYRFGGSR